MLCYLYDLNFTESLVFLKLVSQYELIDLELFDRPIGWLKTGYVIPRRLQISKNTSKQFACILLDALLGIYKVVNFIYLQLRMCMLWTK